MASSSIRFSSILFFACSLIFLQGTLGTYVRWYIYIFQIIDLHACTCLLIKLIIWMHGLIYIIIECRWDHMRGTARKRLFIFDCILWEEMLVGELSRERWEGGVPVQDIRSCCGEDGRTHRDGWVRECLWGRQECRRDLIRCLLRATLRCQALLSRLLPELPQYHRPLLQLGRRWR